MPGRGRPRGSKNRPNHNAGGRREGAGRKRKHPLPEGQAPPPKRAATELRHAFRAPEEEWLPDGGGDIRVGQGSSGLQDHHLPYDATNAEGQEVGHPFEELGQGDGDDQPPDAAVSSLLAAYLNNPVNPIPAHGSGAAPEASAQMAAFGSGDQVKRAVEAALRHSSRAGDSPEWARRTPAAIEGPFLCMASTEGQSSRDRPSATVYGPVDPKLLAPTTVVAVYYACFTREAERAVEGFDLQSLDPSLAGARLFHQTEQPGGQPGQSTSNGAPSIAPKPPGVHVVYREVDPYQPPDVDMSSRQRAPRKCGVCGQYYCKGRGNRSLCPKYDPGRDATPSRALHPGDASQPTPGQADTFPGPDILVDKSTGQPALPRGPYADIGVYNSLNSPGTWRSPGGTTQDGDQSTSAPRTERILIPGTIPRKRGPRHCGVCKQLNCPGNGNRKLCRVLQASNPPEEEGGPHAQQAEVEPEQV